MSSWSSPPLLSYSPPSFLSLNYKPCMENWAGSCTSQANSEWSVTTHTKEGPQEVHLLVVYSSCPQGTSLTILKDSLWWNHAQYTDLVGHCGGEPEWVSAYVEESQLVYKVAVKSDFTNFTCSHLYCLHAAIYVQPSILSTYSHLCTAIYVLCLYIQPSMLSIYSHLYCLHTAIYVQPSMLSIYSHLYCLHTAIYVQPSMLSIYSHLYCLWNYCGYCTMLITTYIYIYPSSHTDVYRNCSCQTKLNHLSVVAI